MPNTDDEPLSSRPMPSSFDETHEFYNEKPMAKILRKLKEEPLVPLGAGLTVFAFVSSYRALRRGDSTTANRMFRARVAAQGFTVLAMVAGGMYYAKDREVSQEIRKLKEQKEKEEKRQKWIRELEIRDEEEKALKAMMEERKAQVSAARAATASAAAAADGEKKEESNGGGVLGALGLSGLSGGWGKSQEAPNAEAQAEKEQKAADEAAAVMQKIRAPTKSKDASAKEDVTEDSAKK
ncbi:hypothetical protein ACRALDRAFT_1064240 [Sodiomyces alcalophilus JCM 7366]|uniref:uncharacterized protein n=1 Tax=Sodiomyces alcalophilus JCM 7366 TaxID=591952 RepID=UPI0039B57C52